MGILFILWPLTSEKLWKFNFLDLYIYFNFVIETSSWAYFKDNFALRKKIKTCVALKLILYILWAYLIYHMLHIWQISTYAKFCVIDMFFWSVYVRADTFTANEVKKQRKKCIINIFDLVRVHQKSPYP